jgi:chromosome segregation ATPase
MFKKEKMPQVPTDEVVELEGVVKVTKERLDVLKAQKAEYEKKIGEFEQRIADCEEEIKEWTAENIRREKLGVISFLRSDINSRRKEIDFLKTMIEKFNRELTVVEDKLFKFGSDEKETEEYN